jgi:hypothetical protein
VIEESPVPDNVPTSVLLVAFTGFAGLGVFLIASVAVLAWLTFKLVTSEPLVGATIVAFCIPILAGLHVARTRRKRLQLAGGQVVAGQPTKASHGDVDGIARRG